MNTTPDTPQNSTNSPAWAHWLNNNLRYERPLFFVLVMGPFFAAMMVPFTTLELAHLYAIPVIMFPLLAVWGIAYGVSHWGTVNAEKKAHSQTQAPASGSNSGAKAFPRRIGRSIILLAGVVVAGYIACVCVYVVPQMSSWITPKDSMSLIWMGAWGSSSITLTWLVFNVSRSELPSNGSQNQTLLGHR